MSTVNQLKVVSILFCYLILVVDVYSLPFLLTSESVSEGTVFNSSQFFQLIHWMRDLVFNRAHRDTREQVHAARNTRSCSCACTFGQA